MARDGAGDDGDDGWGDAGGEAACVRPPSFVLLAGGGRARAAAGLARRGLFADVAVVVAVILSYGMPRLVGWLVK